LHELIQFIEQLHQPIGFGEKINFEALGQSGRCLVCVKTTGQQNRQVRTNAPQCMKSRFAIHLRHAHVDDRNLHDLGCCLEHRYGCRSAPGIHRQIVGVLQHAYQHPADIILIVNHEYGRPITG